MKDVRVRTDRWSGVRLVAVGGLVLIVFAGCVPAESLPQFPGTYDVTRGTAELKVGWVIGSAEGEVTYNGGGGELVPIDPNDVPEILRPLAEAWNDGLEDFNEDLDELFPNQVVISHPQPWLARVENAEDPNDFFQGVNGQEGFLALAGGFQIGALGASTVSGTWDGEDTVSGAWSVLLTLGGSGAQGGGLLLSVAITVPYDAVLVPE